MARFLLALACIFSSAAPALPSESAVDLELELARSPSLYLRLDVGLRVLEVKVRGMVLDTHEVRAVSFVYVIPAAGEESGAFPALPLVLKTAGTLETDWRHIVAPPTLSPFSESAEPPESKPTAVVTPPAQYEVELESGWRLAIGPESPYGVGSRLKWRLSSGWRRLCARRVEPPPPSVVVEMSAEHSRALLHLFAEEISILITCSSPGQTVPSVATATD